MSHNDRLLAIACFGLALSGTPAEATGLPRQFQGTWAEDLAQCSLEGEHSRLTIDRRSVLGYEHGWTIRRWTRRGNVWTGRGTYDDDQGAQPATIRLRMDNQGRLIFNDAVHLRCPARSGAS